MKKTNQSNIFVENKDEETNACRRIELQTSENIIFLQNLFVDILYVNEVAGQDDASKTVSNEIRIQHYKLKVLSMIIDIFL